MTRRPPRAALDRSSAASDVYKRQGEGAALQVCVHARPQCLHGGFPDASGHAVRLVQPFDAQQVGDHEAVEAPFAAQDVGQHAACLLYTSDAADERASVDLGGLRT